MQVAPPRGGQVVEVHPEVLIAHVAVDVTGLLLLAGFRIEGSLEGVAVDTEWGGISCYGIDRTTLYDILAELLDGLTQVESPYHGAIRKGIIANLFHTRQINCT